ncbi:MAG: ABC transporter ATP-binding protein, partial [Lachnospiraceae bacterium]|nr:ABC transporter ATP-binding protein [Lachnospiraceae bacterium]
MMARNTYKEDERLEEAFNIKHLFRAFKYIKKYRRQMLVALFISALGGMFGYLSPMIVRRALDVAVPDQNTAMLYQLAGMLAGVYIFSIAFSTIRSRLMINASQNIIYDIRKDLFAHLQELPFAYYDNRPHGKILIRVVNYVNSVSDMLSNGLINVVLEGFNLIVIIAFMFATDVELALVVMAGVPILAIFMFWIKNRQRKAWQAVSNKNSNLNAYLQENIVGAR